MQPVLLVLLLALIFFFVQAQLVWAAMLVGLLIIADLLGGVFSKGFRFLGGTASAISETIKEESIEVEGASPKPPQAKKFFEESFSQLGKGIGRGERAKAERKKIRSALSMDGIVSSAANFMSGLLKLFRR